MNKLYLQFINNLYLQNKGRKLSIGIIKNKFTTEFSDIKNVSMRQSVGY